MIAWIRKTSVGQSLFAIAVLLALFLRIVIPTGFMPATGSHGLVLQLCSQSVGKTVVLDIGKKTPVEKPGNADSQCAFAAGLGNGLLTSAEPLATKAAAWGLIGPVGTAIANLTVHRLAAPPPPSQAPPALR